MARPTTDGLTLGWQTHRVTAPGQEPVRLRRPRPIVLDDDTLVRHVFMVGSTGSGKTTLMKYILLQQIARGGGAVFIDAKPSIEDTILPIVAMAIAAGRVDDLNLLTPGLPFSHTYNFCEDGSPAEVADRLSALYYSRESEYYRITSHAYLLSLAEAFRAIGRQTHLGDYVAACVSPEAVDLLDRELRAVGRPLVYPALKAAMTSGRSDLFYQVSGVGRALLRYIVDEFGRITLVHRGDIHLERIIRNGEVLYVSLPIMKGYETAIQWGTAFLVHVLNVVGRLIEGGFRSEPPFLLVCDEAGKYSGSALTTLTEQARAAGIGLIIAGQSVEQFRTNPKYGDMMKIVVQNTNTKVCCRLEEDEELRMMARVFGEMPEERITQASLARPAALQPSVSVSEKDTFLVHPWFFRQFCQMGQGFIRVGRARGTPEVSVFRWPQVRLSRRILDAAREYLSLPWAGRFVQPPPEETLRLYERTVALQLQNHRGEAVHAMA